MNEFIPTMYEEVPWRQFEPENQQNLNRKTLTFFLLCPGRKETGRAALWGTTNDVRQKHEISIKRTSLVMRSRQIYVEASTLFGFSVV